VDRVFVARVLVDRARVEPVSVERAVAERALVERSSAEGSSSDGLPAERLSAKRLSVERALPVAATTGRDATVGRRVAAGAAVPCPAAVAALSASNPASDGSIGAVPSEASKILTDNVEACGTSSASPRVAISPPETASTALDRPITESWSVITSPAPDNGVLARCAERCRGSRSDNGVLPRPTTAQESRFNRIYDESHAMSRYGRHIFHRPIPVLRIGPVPLRRADRQARCRHPPAVVKPPWIDMMIP
jgi:hypothetical protein